MTTPGGVPNLPPGALTLDTLASDTQDVSQPAMKARAAGRFSSIFSSSTGLSPSSDITPFGILTSIFAGFNSTVANADPADVDGPEDLPGLLLDFIESLPFVGQFVGLFEAILGEYDGDDETLLGIQTLFAPIRALVDAVTGATGGIDGLGSLMNVFPDLLGAFDGIDFTNPGAILDAIADALVDVPILGDIVAAITGNSGDLTDLTGWFTDLLGIFGNPTGLGTGTPGVGDLSSIPILGPLIEGLLGGDQGVNVLSLFGDLPTELIGLIAPSSIGTSNPNLLINPGFDGAVSLSDTGAHFVYDAAVGRTSPGAARTTCNGVTHSLFSNPIKVTAGQKIHFETYVQWSGVSATGSPFQVQVAKYLDGSLVGYQTIGSVGGAGSGSWTKCTGTDYTVPSSGVDTVRMKLTCASTATAGSVWFDDSVMSKSGNGPFDGILQLFGLSALTDLSSGLNVNAIWSAIISAILNPLGLLQDAGTRNALFGGIPVLGQILPDVVGGVSPGANLLDDVGDFLTNMFNGITKAGAAAASQADTATAVSGQTDTVVGTAATMEQILAALGSGTPDADDFERTSSSNLGANWNVQYSGTGVLATPNGHDAAYTGTGAVEFTARKTDKVASTDHQVSTIVLATAIPSYPFFTPLPYGGNVDLWVRMSAFTTFATRTGLRFRINSAAPYQATWFIHWVNSGTETQLATGSLSIPAAGASISWEVGVGGNTLAYQARVNGSPIANFTDTTNKGLGNTGRGFGGKGTAGFGLPQGVPNIKQWTAQG